MKQTTLKQARTKRRLTQEQLEELSGVAQAVISKIERGKVADPASSTVMKLADALSVDPRSLRFGPARDQSRGMGIQQQARHTQKPRETVSA